LTRTVILLIFKKEIKIRDMTKEIITQLSALFNVPKTKFDTWNMGSTVFIELPVSGLRFDRLSKIMQIFPADAVIKAPSANRSCLVVAFNNYIA
jgi:hypothetical protein